MNRSTVEDALHRCSGVIFDWDGTLADTQDRNYRALSAALALRCTLDRAWYTQHAGLPIRDLLLRLTAATPLPIDRIIATSRANLLATTTADTISPIAPTVDLARRARAIGLPCAVASGAAAVLVEAGLDALDLRQLFQAVVAREHVVRGKPAPDVFLAAAQQLRVAPEQCLAIEDAPDGIAAAHLAGMQVLVVDNGQLRWSTPNLARPARWT